MKNNKPITKMVYVTYIIVIKTYKLKSYPIYIYFKIKILFVGN